MNTARRERRPVLIPHPGEKKDNNDYVTQSVLLMLFQLEDWLLTAYMLGNYPGLVGEANPFFSQLLRMDYEIVGLSKVLLAPIFLLAFFYYGRHTSGMFERKGATNLLRILNIISAGIVINNAAILVAMSNAR
jgi:hypothetical protein